MKISTQGKNRIKGYELLRLKAYMPTPNDVPTIGWGHTGKDVKLGMEITEEHAEELLDHDCAAVESSLTLSVTTPVNQNQVDALGCLVFNVGVSGFLRSHLRSQLNSGDLVKAKGNWLDWDHQGAVELAGLKKRRTEEWALFVLPIAA